jgi:hypothetical protein
MTFLALVDAPSSSESMKFPAFSQLAGNLAFRDGFARDCPLQRRVGSELGPDRDHNFVRTALYEAANVILTRPVKGSTLKSWAMPLAARAGRGAYSTSGLLA